ncbi:MAG: DUF3291 domain-containing protein [Acidimicrobiales bacterium]
MNWYLAAFNVAKAKYPVDDPRMSEFMDNLEAINGLGDASPGFVWRHQTESGDSTSERIFDDPDILLNYTIWESVEALRNYTYKTEHTSFLRRRREWFVPLDGWPVLVLWWVPADTTPSLEEAKATLAHLRDHGPTPSAFTFREPYPRPD